MLIETYDQTLYAWDRVNKEVVTLENSFNSTYYNGNFKGVWRIPITVSSERIYKGAGTTKYDVTPYIKNNGTYIRFNIKGSGYTTALVTGDIKLYFEDGWSGTIEEAVTTGRIDPIVFRYTSMQSSNYLWDTANLFLGGRTNQRNYPYVYICLKPLQVLTHFEFYTNRALNTTYDGFIISQTDITLIGTTPEDVSFNYVSEGYFISAPIDVSNMPKNIRLKWEADIPDGTSITASCSSNEDEWTEVGCGEVIAKNSDVLWVRFNLYTLDSSVTPTLSRAWLEESEIRQDIILLTMKPANRFHNVEGLLTVEYDRLKGNLQGKAGLVESFETSFIPADLEPKLNPMITEVFTTYPNVNVAFQKIAYRDRFYDGKFIVSANCNLNFEYVGIINP